jgi:hypothetical protein
MCRAARQRPAQAAELRAAERTALDCAPRTVTFSFNDMPASTQQPETLYAGGTEGNVPDMLIQVRRVPRRRPFISL